METNTNRAGRTFKTSIMWSLCVSLFVAQCVMTLIREGNCQFYEDLDKDEEDFDFQSNGITSNNDNIIEEDDISDNNNNNYSSFSKNVSVDDDEEILFPGNSGIDTVDSDYAYDGLSKTDKRYNWFQRKITVPPGTLLSLTAQVSRPDIAPGFFYDTDGIIVDAVLEVPIWLKVEKFLEAVYEGKVNHIVEVVEEKSTNNYALGFERCFLYEKLEAFSSSVLEMSPTISQMCLMRAICETQSIATYYPQPPTNVMFELIHLFLTPSLGFRDECYQPYLAAETIGLENGHCSKYASFCPFNIGAIILSNFFPPEDNE